MTTNILEDNSNNKDYLSELVGEGKKYRDTTDLAKAYANADAHIKMLTQANDELREFSLKQREDNENRAKIEDALRQLQIQPKQLTDSTQPPAKEERQPQFNLEDVDKRVAATVAQLRSEEKALENAMLVKNKLKERFGDNYPATVRQQITDLGLTEEDFNALARKSPSTILKTLGVEVKGESFQAPPRSNVNFTPSSEPKKTWSYYQALKQKNPNAYRDPKITNEMTEMALKYGDEFYDGDFNRFG